MKELSIEEKAKRYDEAIAIAKEINNEQKAQPFNVMIRVFPELAESEDEKIMGKIIGTIHLYYGEPLEDEAKEMIAWLEKRCKNNMGISEATKQKLGDNLNKALEKETQESWNKFLEKQGEQKPAWSEEDEQYLLVCKNALAKYQTTDKWDACIISHWLENKLKSLRPQSTWKPSDEQMEALRYVTNFDYGGHKATLVSLYEQLKKLKG